MTLKFKGGMLVQSRAWKGCSCCSWEVRKGKSDYLMNRGTDSLKRRARRREERAWKREVWE